MLAAGARSKDTKINLMDCICLCSEVEIASRVKLSLWSFCGRIPGPTDTNWASFQ